MFHPHQRRFDPLLGLNDPFSLLRQQIGSVFDQFGGGGSTGGWTGTQGGGDRGGQGGETVGFGPAIEDFTGGREGKVTARGSETPGEIMPRGAGEAGTAIGPVMPNFGQLVPRITLDLVEQPDKYIVHAEVPGVKKDDIKLSVANGVLTITAEKRDKHEEKKDDRGYRVQRREIGYGTVTRAIRLPRDAKAEEVRAKFDNGTLEIDIPKEQRGEKKERGNVNIQ